MYISYYMIIYTEQKIKMLFMVKINKSNKYIYNLNNEY